MRLPLRNSEQQWRLSDHPNMPEWTNMEWHRVFCYRLLSRVLLEWHCLPPICLSVSHQHLLEWNSLRTHEYRVSFGINLERDLLFSHSLMSNRDIPQRY